ncbi:MAG: hypothetical protein S4CHLAM20_10030 [Chlamydiia bacterium]|nr:hypothetical protein [Chlamydiia bacterium]
MDTSLQPVTSSSYTSFHISVHTKIDQALKQFVVQLDRHGLPPLTNHNSFSCTEDGYKKSIRQFHNPSRSKYTDTLVKRIWDKLRNLSEVKRNEKIQALKKYPPRDLYKHLIGYEVLESDLLNTKELEVEKLVAITFENSSKALLGFVKNFDEHIAQVETIKHKNLTVPLKHIHPLKKSFFKRIKKSEIKEKTLKRFVDSSYFLNTHDPHLFEGSLVGVRGENESTMCTGYISRRGGLLAPSLYASGYTMKLTGTTIMFYQRINYLFPLKDSFLQEEKRKYLKAYLDSIKYLKQRCTRNQNETIPVILLSPCRVKASYSLNDCTLAFTTAENIAEVEATLTRQHPHIEVYDIADLQNHRHPWMK